jgi:hypothetical protein
MQQIETTCLLHLRLLSLYNPPVTQVGRFRTVSVRESPPFMVSGGVAHACYHW